MEKGTNKCKVKEHEEGCGKKKIKEIYTTSYFIQPISSAYLSSL